MEVLALTWFGNALLYAGGALAGVWGWKDVLRFLD